MKEPYIEGVAIHDDPESCAAVRKGVGEALTGARAGWVSSREIKHFRSPTLLTEAEGNTTTRAIASAWTALRGRRPHARTESSCAEAGRSHGRPPFTRWAAPRRPEAARW
jgi:hypothetical protein